MSIYMAICLSTETGSFLSKLSSRVLGTSEFKKSDGAVLKQFSEETFYPLADSNSNKTQ